MAVLKFKTEFIETAVIGQGSVADNGDYTEGSTSWANKESCDAVLNNGQSELISTEDGKAIQYSYTIYLKPNCRAYAIGEKVRITFRDDTTKEFLVKGVDRRQLQCKVYV